MLPVALGSGIIFTKFDLRQRNVPKLKFFYADTSCHAVTCNCDPLILVGLLFWPGCVIKDNAAPVVKLRSVNKVL